MNILVKNISLPFEEPEESCFDLAVKAAGIPKTAVRDRRIFRRSLDARRRDRIRFLYTVLLEVDEAPVESPHITRYEPRAFLLTPGTENLEHRPVVVGFGPAGMFCALILARMGFRPIVLERGEEMGKRVKAVEDFFATGALCEESNVQFGEGGAGTFSDGKLTTRIGDPRCDYVLSALAAFGAPEEILWSASPHIGTDLLRGVVTALREEIVRLGGEVHFQTKLEEIRTKGGQVSEIKAGGRALPVQCLVLAVGHSARDTFRLLRATGLSMEAKAFSVGARIEHHQEAVDKGLYGKQAGHPRLPKGEYRLSHRDEGGRGVYTFCMCPGGMVVPAASYRETVVTNGMSNHLRDGANANSALVVSVDAGDFGSNPMDAIAFQEAIEKKAWEASGSYRAPVQTADRFLRGEKGFHLGGVTPSYPLGFVPGDFDSLLPAAVTKRMREGIRLFGKKMPGFDSADAVLTGPETRTSSPIRVLREDSLQSPDLPGLYPCGEGAGYAGGIMSAAVDGIRVAEKIVEQYKPID